MIHLKQQTHTYVIATIALVFILALIVPLAVAQPNGATLTETRNERANTTDPGSEDAYAGNLTELVITGVSTTQSWQGYFGNVSGAIELADSAGNALYNWSLTNPGGEVYASTNDTISWTNIQCFNMTARGNYSDESGLGGTVNSDGTNATQLETEYGLVESDADGVADTFSLSGAGTHDAFFTASQSFSEGECPNTRAYDSTGTGVSNNFEEALLYEPTTYSVVFAAILESGSVSGFDGGDYDFEMLVLEDGHSGDTTATTYYFWVEIE